ncbi:uncharacterized protein LOC132051054 [Lycium ferocissimum]|uniref:uncharacterized protein LOC132051054 n=1 Tax=Lycium ferocissimum TaxID=112874 RepID=UPI00281679D6|nr:uncharacterized protein LOC132051054 [Lycium ferocissimum]
MEKGFILLGQLQMQSQQQYKNFIVVPSRRGVKCRVIRSRRSLMSLWYVFGRVDKEKSQQKGNLSCLNCDRVFQTRHYFYVNRLLIRKSEPKEVVDELSNKH